jgi:hypothetical protein
MLGGVNLWLCDFLKRVEPYARYRTPRFYAPHWLSFLTACAQRNFRQAFVEPDSVCDTRIRANVAPSTFFQQCKGGKRARLRSYLLDGPRHS